MDTTIICNALNKLSDYVIYNRMAFCAIDGLRGDCGFWDILGCTAGILAAGALAYLVTLPDHPAILITFCLITGIFTIRYANSQI